MADALANLATTMTLGENETTKVCVCHRLVIPGCLDLQVNASHHTSVRIVEEEDWRKPLIEYIEHGRLPEDPRVRADIKRRAPQFIFHDKMLFRRSYEGLFLRCLDKKEAQKNNGGGTFLNMWSTPIGPKHHFRIKRMGYYWLTMVMYSLEHEKCVKRVNSTLITSINL